MTSQPTRGGHRWVWVLVAVLGVGVVASLLAAAALLPRTPVKQSEHQADQVSSRATTTPLAPEPVQIRPSADGSYPPVLPKQAAYMPPTAQQRRWALATCALLTEMNGERQDLLGGCDRTSANIRTAKQVLVDWWGVSSRKDLLATLSWIEQGGHRRDFDGLVYGLAVATPAEISQLNTEADGNPELANKVAIAQQYGAKLQGKSIAGWDFGRYVYLCRRGYLVGYLNEKEAWQRIMRAAQLMQATFSSWEDLGNNYLIGRKFWSLQQSQQDGAQWRQAQRRLLTESQSPWVKLSWKLVLAPAK